MFLSFAATMMGDPSLADLDGGQESEWSSLGTSLVSRFDSWGCSSKALQPQWLKLAETRCRSSGCGSLRPSFPLVFLGETVKPASLSFGELLAPLAFGYIATVSASAFTWFLLHLCVLACRGHPYHLEGSFDLTIGLLRRCTYGGLAQ